MVRVAVVGDPGAGGTTFLGLLYAAHVRWSAEAPTEFRFQVGPSSLPRLAGIYEQLQAGDFPAAATRAEQGPVEFLYEPHASLAASWRARWGRGSPRAPVARRVVWTRATLAGLRAHLSSGGFATGGARALEGADVLLVLAAPPPVSPTTSPPEPDLDRELAKIWSDVIQFRHTSGGPPRTVGVVFTMLDRLSGARRTGLGLPSTNTGPVAPERRTEVGLRLLDALLPLTRAEVAPLGSARSTSELPFFFLGLETEEGAGRRLELRSLPGGAWEPAYPVDEYRCLIRACEGWEAPT